MKHRLDANSQAMDDSNEVVPKARLARRSLDMMSGSVIGQRYRIGRTIGVGGMGFVYEAVDLQTGVEVALKALPPGAPDPTRVKRLRREAQAATQVRSDHVCRVFYLGVERGTPFIVMERLRGHTLRSQLDNHGAPPFHEGISIICQLLDALTATHCAGVIHRDIKPSNVFLTNVHDDVPRVKLIDFGLAKITGIHEQSQHGFRAEDITSTQCVLGTLQYLAPEQLMGVGELDERSDVYAAGLTLFETLTGQRAFKGSYTEIVHDIVLGDPPRVSTWRPDLPAVLDDVLMMALSKARDRRFASAQAFKRALLAAVQYNVSESGVCPALEGNDDSQAALRDDFGEDFEEMKTVTTEQARDGVRPGATIDDDKPTLKPPPLMTGWEEDEPTDRYNPRDLKMIVAPPRSSGG